jgi:hypothetical protein
MLVEAVAASSDHASRSGNPGGEKEGVHLAIDVVALDREGNHDPCQPQNQSPMHRQILPRRSNTSTIASTKPTPPLGK